MAIGTTLAILGAVGGAAAAGAGAVASAVGTAGSFALANAGTIATVGKGVSDVMGAIESEKAKQNQANELKRQQEVQAAEIKKQNDAALLKRKEGINRQRRQILGAGDNYSLSGTSAVGATRTALLG